MGFACWEWTLHRQYVHVSLGEGNCAALQQHFKEEVNGETLAEKEKKQ